MCSIEIIVEINIPTSSCINIGVSGKVMRKILRIFNIVAGTSILIFIVFILVFGFIPTMFEVKSMLFYNILYIIFLVISLFIALMSLFYGKFVMQGDPMTLDIISFIFSVVDFLILLISIVMAIAVFGVLW